MPIIRRSIINNFKEVLVTESAGLIEDSLGGYILDDPSLVPNGTGDFLGVIKTSVLLAEVAIDTIDTRNLSFTQFNALTQQQFDAQIRSGQISYTRTISGWVEMGRTNASFYYQDCSGGKKPVSEHYYDISKFAFDNKTVVGTGFPIISTVGGLNTPLTPVGNFDPNWYTNVGPIAPGFEPLTLPQYMEFVLFNNGQITNTIGDIRNVSNFPTQQTGPIRRNVLIANRESHFDNQFATEISPGKWASVRGIIEQSLIANVIGIPGPTWNVNRTDYTTVDFGISEGQCLETLNAVSLGGGTTTTVTTGGPPPPVIPPTMPPVPRVLTPTVDELSNFKENLLKRIKEIGFIFKPKKITSQDGELGLILPDPLDYPEILQLQNCIESQKYRLVTESKIDTFIENAYLQIIQDLDSDDISVIDTETRG